MIKSRTVIYALLLLVWGSACSETDSPERVQSVEKQVPQGSAQSLDLSINGLSLPTEQHKTIVADSPEPILPNVFEKTNKHKKASISGKVLREQGNADYVDSIHGAEISVEVKIP